MEPIAQNEFRSRRRSTTPATSSTSALILRSVENEFKPSIRNKIVSTIISVNSVKNYIKPKTRSITPGPELQDKAENGPDEINSDVIYISTHSIPKTKTEPFSTSKRTCKPKAASYSPPKWVCKPKAEPCSSLEWICNPKAEPCSSPEWVCNPKAEPYSPPQWTCKPKAEPYSSPEWVCNPKAEPYSPPQWTCKPKAEPYSSPEWVCNPKAEPCSPTKRACKPKAEPYSPPIWARNPKAEPYSSPEWVCNPKAEPCSPTKRACKPKAEPYSSPEWVCNPKAEPYSPRQWTCKPKAEPCSPPKRACKQPRDINKSATSFEPPNRLQNRTKISTPAAVASTWSRIFHSKKNQVAGPSARAVPPTSTAIVTYDELEVPPFSSSTSPTSSDSGRQRERQVPRQGFGKRKRKKMRIEYTQNEGQKILDYICRNHMHPYTGGNQIWREMSLDKVTPHTEQSMKEHFRKKMYPRMFTSYRCSSPDRKKFELAEREVSRGRRVPKYTRTSRVYPPR